MALQSGDLLEAKNTLAVVIQFYGEGYNLTAVTLERLGIQVSEDLLFCRLQSAIVLEFQLYHVDGIHCPCNNVNAGADG